MQSIERIRNLTPHELALFGMQDVAYIKRVEVEGAPGYAVHAADGTQIALVGDRDLAFATVRQHEMEPVSVH